MKPLVRFVDILLVGIGAKPGNIGMTLNITRKKTGLWLLTITDANGAAQDLTGLTLHFHATAGLVAINKSSPTSGIVITNAVGGLATLQLDPTDTAALPAGEGIYSVPCELTLVDGSSYYELARGDLHIDPNVGEP